MKSTLLHTQLFIILTLLIFPSSELGNLTPKTEVGDDIHMAKQAPHLRVKDAQGNRIELSSLKGKVVFINFWATWCPPCIREMPSIRRLRKKYKENEDLVFLLIDVEGNLKLSQAFLKLRGIDLPVYAVEGDIPDDFLPAGIPTTLLIDRANYVAGRQIGGADYMAPGIIARIDQLLAERIEN
ncbi:MAG: TlpA family protein disulfide reductase [Sphingobacterium sp.]